MRFMRLSPKTKFQPLPLKTHSMLSWPIRSATQSSRPDLIRARQNLTRQTTTRWRAWVHRSSTSINPDTYTLASEMAAHPSCEAKF
eukprot:442263-Amphidinium_carterae.1